MAKQTVRRTALGVAICRMIEQYQPEKTRLFYDPVAKELVGAPIRFVMQSALMRGLTLKQTDAAPKGLYGALMCRTRYIDDVVQAAISQGIKQLVILGAGYDTRPYRLPGMESIRVFEVDLPLVQDDKKKKLKKYLGRLPDHVSFIPIDFDTQTLEASFSGTAFSPAKPAIFLWEGVTQYISEEAVRKTLASVGNSIRGSIIVFTYVLKSIIEGRSDIPGVEHLMDAVAKQAPWAFGLEPCDVPDLLQLYHLTLLADVGRFDYQEKYLKPIERNLFVFAGERIAQATVI